MIGGQYDVSQPAQARQSPVVIGGRYNNQDRNVDAHARYKLTIFLLRCVVFHAVWRQFFSSVGSIRKKKIDNNDYFTQGHVKFIRHTVCSIAVLFLSKYFSA